MQGGGGGGGEREMKKKKEKKEMDEKVIGARNPSGMRRSSFGSKKNGRMGRWTDNNSTAIMPCLTNMGPKTKRSQ